MPAPAAQEEADVGDIPPPERGGSLERANTALPGDAQGEPLQERDLRVGWHVQRGDGDFGDDHHRRFRCRLAGSPSVRRLVTYLRPLAAHGFRYTA